MSNVPRLQNNTIIRHIAFRKSGDSQDHGGPIEGPLNSFSSSQQFHTEGFRSALHWFLIMTRPTNVRSQYVFFHKNPRIPHRMFNLLQLPMIIIDWQKHTSAVRRSDVSRHNGGPIEGPLEPLNTILM